MEEKQLFKCEHCGKEYTRADFYHKHMEKEHSDGTTAIETVLSTVEKKVEIYTDNTLELLKQSFKIVYKNKFGAIIKKKYGAFICHHCGRKFDSKPFADKHDCKMIK